jgi:hypothetical protein
MNRRKKNPPIKEQMEASVASGYFLYFISPFHSIAIGGDHITPVEKENVP